MATATTEDVIQAFFDQLALRGSDPQLERTTGSIRIDVENGTRTEHWLLTISKGNVRVGRENGEANLVIRLNRRLFERVVRGKANALAGLLRSEIRLEGSEPPLFVAFQRLLPRPKGAHPMAGRTVRRGG